MRWVVNRHRRAGHDHGAVAVIVAVVLTGCLLGLGAFVTDAGGWFAERAQLQNGADGAALAVAQGCVRTGACDTSLAPTSTAGKYANLNANDNLSTVDYICGSGPGLSACAGDACPSGTGKFVNVHTKTLVDGGSHLLPPMMGKLLLGQSYNGQTINACAQAKWGSFGGGTGLAITMSLCAWQAATGGTATPTYATPAPPYKTNPWPPGYTKNVTSKAPVTPNVGGENVVQIHGDAKPCNDSSSGLNIPGGFAWLSNSPNGAEPTGCKVTTTADGYVYNNPGGLGGKQSECANALTTIYGAGTPIPNASNPFYIPIFDLACGSNGTLDPTGGPCPAGMPNGSYHIAGYATFILTGYDVSPISASSMITGKNPCKGSFDCLYGLFTKGLVLSTGDISDGHDFGGPTVVKLSG